MSRPALSMDEAFLHGQERDLNRVSRAAPKPSHKSGRPKFPSHLPESCHELWKEIVKLLARRKTLTPGDGPSIALYCRQHLQWQQACADVEKRGVMITETHFSREGNPYEVCVVNPAVKVSDALSAKLQDYLRDMGLTGKDREKVSQVKKEDSKPALIPGTVAFFRAQAAQAEAEAAPVEDFVVTDLELETTPLEETNGNSDSKSLES